MRAPTAREAEAYLSIKGEVEALLGQSIYERLPGVVQRTFGPPWDSPAAPPAGP
jgi:hypothetical protein